MQPADLDGNGQIDQGDLRLLIRQIFDPQALSRSADLNRDGTVSAADLVFLASRVPALNALLQGTGPVR